MGFPELPVVLVSPSLEGGVSQSLITVSPPPQPTRTRRWETGAVPALVATPQPWPGAQPAPWHPPKRHPPPSCPPTCRPWSRLTVTCWAPVWSASEWLCPQRPKPRQTPLGPPKAPTGHWTPARPQAWFWGCPSCWVPLWRIWEGFLVHCWVPAGCSPPHGDICPGAARPSGRCRTRCGGCGCGWRRACAAPAAIPREKPLPVSPRAGRSR